MRFYVRAVIACMTAAFATIGDAIALPPCAPPVEARDVRVIRVEKNGALVLEDGRAVRVEGLLFPRGARDHAPKYLADAAIAVMEELLRGRKVNLLARAPKEDRYGRLRAQVFVDEPVSEPWLQAEMLHRGLARVSIAPDRRECVSELLAAENVARGKHAGVWSQAAYALRNATDSLSGFADTFEIVQGTVVSARIRGGRAYLDFGEDWHRDFTVTISSRDLRTFREAGVDPETYEGKSVRVRGWLEVLHRPEIEIAGPEDIEVLGTD